MSNHPNHCRNCRASTDAGYRLLSQEELDCLMGKTDKTRRKREGGRVWSKLERIVRRRRK